MLFQLLHPLMDRHTALMNLLQGGITRTEEWRWRLKNNPRLIDGTIRERFNAAFGEQADLQARLRELLDTTFRRYHAWPAEARHRRDEVIGALRRVLAGACVHALEPDLVILDEFQRFKELLGTQGTERHAAAELAQELFQAKAHDGRRVRTLLLSATPYKLYTADAEIEHEEHYEDFLATTRFLLGDDEARVQGTPARALPLRGGAAARGRRRPGAGETRRTRSKRAVEGALQDVMARTERVPASDDRDAMVAEDRRTTTVTASDVRQYLAADALFQAVGGRDPMPFWKSAPYLAHFMHGYRFNERLDEAIHTPDKMVDALQRHESAFLKAETLRSWGRIDPGHAKLRELVGELIDEGLWRLLWMPPTVRYWPLEGPFEGKERGDQAAVVLGLEHGTRRGQRRPELRSRTADDGRPARLLREARRAAAAAVEIDAVDGRRPVPASSPPAASAVPAAGGSRASAGRTGGAGPAGLGASPRRRAAGGPGASGSAGRAHRRPLGMGGAALAGSGIVGVSACVA